MAHAFAYRFIINNDVNCMIHFGKIVSDAERRALDDFNTIRRPVTPLSGFFIQDREDRKVIQYRLKDDKQWGFELFDRRYEIQMADDDGRFRAVHYGPYDLLEWHREFEVAAERARTYANLGVMQYRVVDLADKRQPVVWDPSSTFR